MKKLSFIILICLSLNSMGQGSITKLRIDPTYARGGTAADVFEELEFIPLETTDKSLFGQISQLEVTDDYIIVSDIETRDILLFKKNGKFHCKLSYDRFGKNKLDPAFSVDRENKEIIARLYSDYQRLLYFNYNGEYLRDGRIPAETNSFRVLDGQTILCNTSLFGVTVPAVHDTGYFIKYATPKGVVSKGLLPFNAKYIPKGPELSLYGLHEDALSYNGINGSCLFTNMYDYTVKQLNKDGVQKAYQIILPANRSLPDSFLTEQIYAGKRFNFLQQNEERVYKLSNVYTVGDYLLFKTLSNKFKMKDKELIYNVKTKNLLSWERITADSVSCNLPIFQGGMSSVRASDGNSFYVSLPSFILFAYKNAKDNDIYQPALKAFYATGNSKGNPVIIRLKPRKNL